MIFEGHFLNFQQIRFALQDRNLGMAASVYSPTGDRVALLVARQQNADRSISLVPFGVLHPPGSFYYGGDMVDVNGRLLDRAMQLFTQFENDLLQNVPMGFEDSAIFGGGMSSRGVTVKPVYGHSATAHYSLFLPSDNPYDVFRDPSVY